MDVASIVKVDALEAPLVADIDVLKTLEEVVVDESIIENSPNSIEVAEVDESKKSKQREDSEEGEEGEEGEEDEEGEGCEEGEAGDEGEAGEVGDEGEEGEGGDEGEEDDEGEAANEGEEGEVGEAGDEGEEGEVANEGEEGEAGETGYEGEAGEAGDEDEAGDAGEVGDEGEEGEKIEKAHNQCESNQLLEGFGGCTTHTTTTGIIVNWCPPCYDPETIFHVEMKLHTALDWTFVYYGKATSFTMTQLPPGTNVGIRIRGIKEGINHWSCEAQCSTSPSPPEAPLRLIALSIGSNKIELEWSLPIHNGGSPITGFCLEMKMQQSTQSFVPVYIGNNTRFVAKGLEPGATYCFRVRALNSLGIGPYGESIMLATRAAPPTIPQSPVIVEKASKSVSLSWLVPPCNGASIESFTLQMLDLGYDEKRFPTFDGSNASNHFDLQGANLTNLALATHDIYSGPSNDFVVKKLRPFSSYAFRVQAHNVAGSSGFSAFVTCMTSAASPCPPPPPTVVATDSSSMTLNWKVPNQDNGSPVLRYTLEMQKVELQLQSSDSIDCEKKKLGKKDGAMHLSTRVWIVVYDGQRLESQVSCLAPGNEYSFRVKAHSALGTSPPSPVLVARTLCTAPSAPRPPNFSKVMATSMKVKWSSPACDNGLPVTSYKLILDDGQGGELQKVYEGEARSYTVSKLIPSSSYRAAVQAINARGASKWSAIAVVQLPSAQLRAAPPPTPSLTPSPTTDLNDLPRKERQAPVAVASVARERQVPTMVSVAASGENKNASPPESIRSRKEVKALLRHKTRHTWTEKVRRSLLEITEQLQIQQPRPRWTMWICIGALFATVLLLYTLLM